ncbi:MAG TPA: coproporphyrinogen III oxidase, partial [Plasticicumulans sp.]|nr:coproporphyrinogen III oxidase [Plasticicumulans sp.]
MPTALPVSAIRDYLLTLQDRICAAIAAEDGAAGFRHDDWTRPEDRPGLRGDGRTRVLADGAVF